MTSAGFNYYTSDDTLVSSTLLRTGKNIYVRKPGTEKNSSVAYLSQ
jgi:hypothetical protein